MSSDNGVFVFPDVAKAATNGIDPNLLLAMQINYVVNFAFYFDYEAE